MDLVVNRTAFLQELSPMMGIVERKSTIRVLSHVMIQATGNELKLAATDLDVSLTSSLEGDITGEGGVVVPAKKFHEIVRACSGEEMRLTCDEGNSLEIKAGKSRFKILGLATEEFPKLPVVEGDALGLPFATLQGMVGKVIFAVSTEDSRFQLNGALLKMKNGSMELVATDGHRLALVENSVEGGEEAEGVLIPRKALMELQRLDAEGSVGFSKGENHLSFALGNRTLTCRILEGTFPDYERVIARDHEKNAVLDRAELLEVVQRVSLLTGDRLRSVRCEFSEDQLTVSATNPELGEAVEQLECALTGEEVKIGLNPDYLAQFLTAVDSKQIQIHLKDENAQSVAVPVEGNDSRYLCVIMPMRLTA